MNQISLFKISYDFEYVDSWYIPADGIVTYLFANVNSFTNVENITLTWKLSNTPIALDEISKNEFAFSNSPHIIWPRPYTLRETSLEIKLLYKTKYFYLIRSGKPYIALNDLVFSSWRVS